MRCSVFLFVDMISDISSSIWVIFGVLGVLGGVIYKSVSMRPIRQIRVPIPPIHFRLQCACDIQQNAGHC